MRRTTFKSFAVIAVSSAMVVGVNTASAIPAFAATGQRPDVVAHEIRDATTHVGTSAHVVQGRRSAGNVHSADGHQVLSTGNGPSSLTATNDDGDTLVVDLPTSTSAPASVAADGSIVYSAAKGKGEVAAQILADGTTRLVTTIPSADAPSDFVYQTHLGAGTSIRSDGKGGLDFVKSVPSTNGGLSTQVTLGHMDAPWAVDANGRSVPTSYTVVGNRITQHVTVSPATAFPVVADPHIFWPAWYMPEVLFSNYETGQVRNPEVLWALAGTICALVAAETLGVGCAAFAAESGAIAAVASNAYGDRRCLALRYGVVPYEVDCRTGW